MYAIIKDGGKQYKITEGESLLLERKDVEPGAQIRLEEVLMYVNEDDVRIGTPTLSGVKITAQVDGEEKGVKQTTVKFRRRKGYKIKKGHRQNYMRVTIKKIAASQRNKEN